MAAFSASASFCAFDFFFPKTFKLVLDVVATEAVDAADGAITDGRTTKADVVENDKQTKAKRREMTAEKDFMMISCEEEV